MTPLGIIAKRVDHINMRVPDPGALFGTLAETLRLPVLWPLSAFSGLEEVGIPGFEVAAVCVGNTYIEPTRFEPAATPNRSDDGYAFSVCLEPVSAEDAAGELDRRGIVHSPPIPYIGELPEAFESEIGRQVGLPRGDAQLWSWVFLGGIVGDPALAAHVFLCEFQALNAGAIWRRSREELRRRHGGPLGVQGVREIVIGARDVATEAERWRSLLDPAPVTAGATFELGRRPRDPSYLGHRRSDRGARVGGRLPRSRETPPRGAWLAGFRGRDRASDRPDRNAGARDSSRRARPGSA